MLRFNDLRQSIKYRMSFTRREQLAILSLIVVLMVLLLINLFPSLILQRKEYGFHDLDSIMKLREELRNNPNDRKLLTFDAVNPDADALADRLKPFSFDPNRLPESEWRKMGLTDKQINTIFNYEKSGGKFLKKSDLQKIYTLSLAEYRMLEPYIVISGTEEKAPKQTAMEAETSAIVNKVFEPLELNSADSIELVELPGIGPWFAHRILHYRRLLGGYRTVKQLNEVYGIDSVKYTQIAEFFTVDPSHVQLLRVNHSSFKELMRHPYMNYSLTKALVSKRERQGFLRSWDELVLLNQGDTVNLKRLEPYLIFN